MQFFICISLCSLFLLLEWKSSVLSTLSYLQENCSFNYYFFCSNCSIIIILSILFTVFWTLICNELMHIIIGFLYNMIIRNCCRWLCFFDNNRGRNQRKTISFFGVHRSTILHLNLMFWCLSIDNFVFKWLEIVLWLKPTNNRKETELLNGR